MTPEDLDNLLSKGYFRMSNGMIKTRYFCFDDRLSSLVHIRVNIGEHRLTKKHRRILRKVTDRFTVLIGKPEITDPIRELYHQGKSKFKASIFHHLDDFLGYYDPSRPFDSIAVKIYDGEKLAAFSIFDRGVTSLYSVIAVYHPDYAAYSLGHATLLAEINWGKENGYLYHYPGYIFDNNPVFDYKLTAGSIEILNEDEIWQPFPRPFTEFAQTGKLREKYDQIGTLLNSHGIAYTSHFNPYFISNDLSIDSTVYIRGFILYILRQEENTGFYRAVDYDPQKDIYYYDQFERKPVDPELLAYQDISYYYLQGNYLTDFYISRQTLYSSSVLENVINFTQK